MKIAGKIKWCCKQRHGVELIESNKNLADAFISKAEKSLEEMQNAKYIESKISFAYYTMYNDIYVLLQHIGIKSEIHTCTFECIKIFLLEHFNEKECEFMEKSLHARNDTTYYVNKEVPDEQADEMMKKAPEMIIKCKSILQKITEQKINEVRSELEKIKNPKTNEVKY